MKELLTLEQMCKKIAVSRTRYYDMLKKGTKWYDPDLPKPKDYYGDDKKRFSSEDVDKYIDLLEQRVKSRSIAA